MVVVPQLLIECGWSTRDRPIQKQWVSKCGVRTTGDPRYGVPYRFDRLVVLYLATKAARRGAAFRGDLHELTELFDVRWRPDTTLRRLRRVACCSYERMDSPDDDLCPRTTLAQRLRTGSNQQFSVTLCDEFMRELEQGAQVSSCIVRHLAERPGTLDLYLWQALAIHQVRAATVSIFSPDGPLAVLPSATNRSRARQDICDRQAEIRQIWKECPYRVSTDGAMLIYDPVATQPEPTTQQAKSSPRAELTTACPMPVVRPTLSDSTMPRSSARPAQTPQPAPSRTPQPDRVAIQEPHGMGDSATLAAIRELRDALRTILTTADQAKPAQVEPNPAAQVEPNPAEPLTDADQPQKAPDPGRGLGRSTPSGSRRRSARKRKRYQQRASRKRNRG